MEIEIWKDIPGYEGLYQASNLGNVKSLSTTTIRNSKMYNKKERILKPKITKSGYCEVSLYNSIGKKYYRIHRLVMLSFVGENDLCVNHKDGIKNNNSLENLEYCTTYENNLHKYKSLGYKSTLRKPISQYNICGRKVKDWSGAIEASEVLGINYNSILNNCSGRSKSAGGFIWKRLQYE